jgi:hypothetical protein
MSKNPIANRIGRDVAVAIAAARGMPKINTRILFMTSLPFSGF